MISSVQGHLGATGPTWVVVTVGGVGFRVEVPSSVVSALASDPSGGEVTLHTSLIVREDSLTLFGFASDADRDGFDILLSVSGIGPRLALAAIDVVGLNDLRHAIATSDLSVLQRIPGVGKKTAQRMVLEIGDKLGTASAHASQVGGPGAEKNSEIRESVEAGLEQLGWPRAVATRAVDSLTEEYPTPELMLRAALAALGAHRGF